MLLQRLGNDPLQLAIGRAELIGCPFLYGSHRLSVYTQNETLGFTFLFGHNNKGSLPPTPPKEGLGEAPSFLLMIQRTRVNHWLCRLIGTEHYEQVAHHGCLLLFIEVNDLLG